MKRYRYEMRVKPSVNDKVSESNGTYDSNPIELPQTDEIPFADFFATFLPNMTPEEVAGTYPWLIELVNCSEWLNQGTENLVNHVIEKHQQGQPIDTMVFLDRSARNGAYLFQVMWRELVKLGKIPPEISLPRIRFLNVGTERSTHQKLSLDYPDFIKSTLRGEDYVGRNVLVVDECYDTGRSLTQTMSFVNDLFLVESTGAVQFKTAPPWYDYDSIGIKGIEEAENDEFGPVRWAIYSQKKSGKEISDYVVIARRLGRELFEELVSISREIDFSSQNFSVEDLKRIRDVQEKYHIDFFSESIQRLMRFTNSDEMKKVSPEGIWVFMQSLNGLLSVKLEDEEKKKNLVLFRLFLKNMVGKRIESVDLDIHSIAMNARLWAAH